MTRKHDEKTMRLFPSKMLDYLRVSRLKSLFYQAGTLNGILQIFSCGPKFCKRARQLQRTEIITQALDSRARIFELIPTR